jgi:hypothetical protein
LWARRRRRALTSSAPSESSAIQNSGNQRRCKTLPTHDLNYRVRPNSFFLRPSRRMSICPTR